MKKQNQSLQPNLFSSKYEVRIISQRLIDIETGEEIKLKEGTTFSFEVPNSQIINTLSYPIEEILVKKDQDLSFRIRQYMFTLKLLEDLPLIIKKGNKRKLGETQCELINVKKDGTSIGYQPVIESTLSSFFRETYDQFFTTGANNRNVFLIFKKNGKSLDQISKNIISQIEHKGNDD